jgi:two-component system response regulator MprA
VNRQVLLVEDDPDLLGSLASLLQAEGYQVQCARHGLEALGRLRGGCRPAVILLDLIMPIMSGWEFRDAQRQDSDLCRIPVVVVSGLNDSARHAAWLEADGYVQKPIQVEILLETLRRYCGGQVST